MTNKGLLAKATRLLRPGTAESKECFGPYFYDAGLPLGTAINERIPRNRDFLELFDVVAANVLHAARLLVAMIEQFTNLDNWAKELHELEEDGDLLTHEIMKKLNKTFITPIDKEDIHALASKLDDILDFILCTAERIALFKMTESTKTEFTKWAITMSKDLFTTIEYVQKAIKKLKEKNYPHIREYCIRINQLENDLDRDYVGALCHLFDEINDNPVLIIKWKEIYEYLRDTYHRCEDVANTLEAITFKNS